MSMWSYYNFCSYCNYYSLYKCSCGKYLCPEHYKKHERDKIEHKMSSILIPVNSESRNLLLEFIIYVKGTFMTLFNQYLESNPYSTSRDLNRILIKCASFPKIILFLMKAKSVPVKIIYTPLEFLLIQETDKTLKSIENLKKYLKNSENWDIPCFLCYNYFSDFYDNYCYGTYVNSYSKMDYGFIEISFSICSGYLMQGDFEMALTTLRNLKYSETFWPMNSPLSSLINLAISTIIDVSNKNFTFGDDKMRILIQNCDFYLDLSSFAIINNFEILFKIMKKSKLSVILLRYILKFAKANNKALIICKACYQLGMTYKIERRFNASERYFRKVIRLMKYSDNWILKFIFLAYHNLNDIYISLNQPEKIVFIDKIYKLLDTISYESNEEKAHFYIIFGQDLNFINKPKEALFLYKKCLKYKPPVIQTNYQRYIFGLLYCLRCTIHLDLGNFKYSHQSLYNAKALLEIIFPKNHPVIIDLKLLLLELKFNWSRHGEVITIYEELQQDNSEWLTNHFKSNHGLLYYSIVCSYIWKGDLDKALKMSQEPLKWYSKNAGPFYVSLFAMHINLYAIYRIKNKDTNKMHHLNEALKYLDDKFYAISQMLPLINTLAKACFNEKDSKNCKILCENILNKPECKPNRHNLVISYILLARIYYAENKEDLWRKYLNDAEEGSKLNQILELNSLNSKEIEKAVGFRIHMNDVDAWLSIGEAYSIDSKRINNGYWNKAESILLFCERYLENNYREEKGVKSNLYQVLIVLFFWQKRYEDASNYCLKYINIWENWSEALLWANSVLYNLSFEFFREKKFEKAKFFGEESIKVFESTEDYSDFFWDLIKNVFAACKCLGDSNTIKYYLNSIRELRLKHENLKINLLSLEEANNYGVMLLINL